MKLLVLAGGFGTRLQGALPSCPKALAPVGNRALLHLQLENWVAQGLREFIFLLHHQWAEIVEFLVAAKSSHFHDCQFEWIVESVPMGTGGAISNAVEKLQLIDYFLVANADTWVGDGVRELTQSRPPSIAVIQRSEVGRYGQVSFGYDKIVTEFAEKINQPLGGWINAGFYHLSPKLFKDYSGRCFSLERVLLKNLVENRCLTAIPLRTDFIDIGIPMDYFRFCRWVEGGRQTPL